MAFPWYQSNLPDWFKQELDKKGVAQVADRIRAQARILRNLNYPLEVAIPRVRLYLKWEWELPKGWEIPCWDEVDDLVKETYAMGVKHTERGFPDPAKVREDIRKVYSAKILDAGAC